MKRILRVWMVFCLLFSAPVYVEQRSEIDGYTQMISELPADTLSLHKDLVRWYNLNLRSCSTDDSYENSRDQILYFENGMIGYVKIPSLNKKIPIYHDARPDSFYLAVNSPFPSDLEGVHIRLISDFLLDLEEGDLFYIVCLDETFVYRIGTEGSNRCDLICAGLNYPGAYIVED